MSTHSLPFIATVALVVAATMRHETAHTEVAATAPSVVTITATDYAFQAPDTIAAGFTTFRLVNNSDQIHMAQLIRLEPGRTMDEYIEAYSESFRTRGPRPQWATRVGGPGAAPPHGTSNATQYLEPGRYLWVCNVNPPPDRIPHVMKRMAKAFVVRAAGATTPARTPPASDVVIQLIDFGFTVSPTLAPGRHTIRVENVGREPHEIGIMKLAPGTTEDSVQKVRDWMQNPDGPPPASVSAASLVGGISSLATGGEAYFEADLTTGDYVLFCFVTAPDGRPHTAHGMVQHIRIAGAQVKPPLALTHVAVVNVADGSVKRDMTVLVQGSRIRTVAPTVGGSLPESAVVVNAAGKFLIPGLWDMHVHSAARVAWHFPLMVANGITGVRNMHTTADTALELIRSVKRRLAAGELIGPRFLANGALLDGDPSVWEGAVLVRTPAEARAAVDSLAAGGADFIKVYDNLARDAYFAIADQARRRGIPMVGHVPFRIRPEEAARAGQRTDEHASGLSFGCSTRADSIRAESVRLAGRASSMSFVESLVAGFRLERALYDTRDPSRCAATITAYRRNGVAVVPTLVIARNPNYPELVLSDTASMRFIPAALRREWEGLAGSGVGDTLGPLLRPTMRPRLENVRQLNTAGVPILAGTDLGNPMLVPGVSLHQELELLVEAGLTPLEALRSATLNAAKFLAATDSLGTIESGKLADLVLVEANPLESIANARKIAGVMLNGRYFDRLALDALLARAEAEARSTVVTISATDYAFQAPDTLPAGWTRVRLVNQGDQPHGATLVRLDPGRTLPEYIQAYREANRTRGARPDWARFLGGPVALLPHGEGNATLHLEPGNYAWVCFVPGPDHIAHVLAHNQARPFVVRPGSGDAPAPKPPELTASLRVLDYSFQLSAPLKAGKHVIRIENAGIEPHHLLVFKLAPGRTLEDFQSRDLDLFEAWLWNHKQGEAPTTFVGGMDTQSRGAEAYLELELPAGDYVIVCLVGGRDGVPHIAKGMIQHVRID